MFVGEYNHTIDPKGRLAVPYRMRSELADGAVVTRGLDGCLAVYTKKEWETLAGRVANLPLADAKARRFSRFFLASAAEVECDKQGRILIPATLRQYAELGSNVVVAGVYNRIELWSAKRWTESTKDVKPEEDLEGLTI